MAQNSRTDKSLESWIWDAACSIRGAKDAPKYKDYILPLIFTKRLCDVFDDELNRIAKEFGSRAKAFKLVKHDKKLVRFYLPLKPANMNMIIHDMEGEIEIGDTFKNPKFRKGNRLRTFDRVVTNPMWNQDWWTEKDYDADEWDRFPKGAGFPGRKADWGWVQIVLASLNDKGRAAVVLDTGAASRGSGNANTNKEKDVRKWFVEQDVIEGVIYLPENLFYNTTAPGIILFLSKAKPKDKKGKLFVLNASLEFTKGDPKNYLSDESIRRIVEAFLNWKEQDKLPWTEYFLSILLAALCRIRRPVWQDRQGKREQNGHDSQCCEWVHCGLYHYGGRACLSQAQSRHDSTCARSASGTRGDCAHW